MKYACTQAMEKWETTIVNLGHCHRKLGNLHQAVKVRLASMENNKRSLTHGSGRPLPPLSFFVTTCSHPPVSDHPPTQLYERGVGLCPRRASSYAALAFTHQLLGELDVAIEYYHRALGLRPDDAFAATMLSRALSEVLALQAHAAEVQERAAGQGAAPGWDVLQTPGLHHDETAMATPPLAGRSSIEGTSSLYQPMAMADDSYDLDDDDDDEEEMAG
jgi:tetratricopeptide (TPR) repeat protein